MNVFAVLDRIWPNNFLKMNLICSKNFLHNRISSSGCLNVSNHSKSINTFFSIKMNKVVDHNNHRSFFVCLVSTVIIPYLHSFIKCRCTNDVFPDNCTISRIVPLFKNGKRDEPTNYRLISIQSCFFKTFEKMIYKRL